MSEERPRVEFVEFLKRLAECPDFIVNGIDTVGPAPDGQSADVHMFVNGERLKVYVQGPPQMYEMVDFCEAAREWVPKLLEERERLRELVKSQERGQLELGSTVTSAGDRYVCPWCGTGFDEPHTAKCDAFNADGSVR